MCDLQCIHILHFTFTLMAHCTSGAIRGSVSCSRTLRQGIELATFGVLNDFSTPCTTPPSCATATPVLTAHPSFFFSFFSPSLPHCLFLSPAHTHKHTHTHTHTHTHKLYYYHTLSITLIHKMGNFKSEMNRVTIYMSIQKHCCVCVCWCECVCAGVGVSVW